MIIFNSLKEVSNFAHDLVINHSVKDLRKINPTTIIDFTVGAKYHLAKLTKEYAKQLNLEVKSTSIIWAYRNSGYYGFCEYERHKIQYFFTMIFEKSYNGVIETIVHELTHLQVNSHNLKFWEQLLVNLKKLEILDPRTSFDEFFVKQYDRNQAFWCGHRDTLICRSIFSENDIVYNFPQQCIDTYYILRRNKMFDLKTAREQCTGERQPKEEYDYYVDLIENAYEDYKRITFHEIANGRLYYDTFHSFQYYYPLVSQNETAFY